MGDQLARQVDCGVATDADAQEECKQFRVRQGAGAPCEQLFAGSFRGRPGGDGQGCSFVARGGVGSLPGDVSMDAACAAAL